MVVEGARIGWICRYSLKMRAHQRFPDGGCEHVVRMKAPEGGPERWLTRVIEWIAISATIDASSALTSKEPA